MGEPAYERIYDEVRGKIQSGDWKPGEQLPKIEALAAAFDVGKTTIKTALRLLERDGWVRGQQGKGVFVADRPPRAGKARRTG